jgi:hypothetical protein
MSYQKLDGTVRNDYRFMKDGSYTDRDALPRKIRRSGVAGKVRSGKVCVACGTVRSVTNKCECNS